MLQHWIFNGKQRLHAFQQVARHPVSATNINFFFAAVGEVENPAVLEKASDNAAYLDVVADAAHARPQSANAAHHQVNLHSRLRGAIELAHDVAVQQRIHLDDDSRRTSMPRMIRFPGDQIDATLSQIDGRNQQRTIAGALGIGGEEVKYAVDGRGHFRIGGQQAQVGVIGRGDRVVVPRSQMRVEARLVVRIFAHHQGQFAVRLQADQSVEDLHSGIFQRTRPANIASFIEARLHLDDNRDFFLGGGFDQGLHDGRVLAGAVKRLLDRQYVGIFGGGADKSDYRIVGIVGMMQQDVAVPNLLENVL